LRNVIKAYDELKLAFRKREAATALTREREKHRASADRDDA